MAYKTEQEEFWATDFGDDYISRNQPDLVGAKTHALSQALKTTSSITSALELGANIGLNLDALKILKPNMNVAGIEINEKAFNELKVKHPASQLGSIFDYQSDKKFDLAMTLGVLIHINPEFLDKVYETLWNCSNRYILVSEYYNPAPTQINYRGHKNRLFKRDFAGELMDKYPLELRDYGFNYHRDPNFPLDDLNWFLMEKKS